MKSVDVCVRYSDANVILDKVTSLSIENCLVFKDEGENFRAAATTAAKFMVITAASPLIGIVRIIRAITFACNGDFNRAGREFIGGLAMPFMAFDCLIGSLISCAAYPIDKKSISLSIKMRRTYAYFEAWVNQINLQHNFLASFNHRASSPYNFMGIENGISSRVWTTAPCMQPVLESGLSKRKGMLDVARMQKIFPLIKISAVEIEDGKVVLRSAYEDKHQYVSLCNGACEHERSSMTCCCFRIEKAYDRVLCCEIGQGNCTSIADHNDTCGFIFCSAGCIRICCCTEKNNLTAATTCLA